MPTREGCMKLTIAAVLLLITAAIGWFYLHQQEVSSQPSYVTSDNCQACHQEYYAAWKRTLHPIMFRPVESDDDILGDFESDDPAVTFKKDEIEFVVGNKWEQVYVRIIDGEYYPFPAKWMVMLKKWVPYKVHNWQETTMSTKCNGCHTTGFDPQTLKFSEFGIGCEACHGPGNQHVMNQEKESQPFCQWCHADDPAPPEDSKDIINTVSPSICAQCHNRGTSSLSASDGGANISFNFPTKTVLGENVGDNWQPLTKERDKKGKYWWGSGVSKNRHQEYADWNRSKHSKALNNLLARFDPEGGRGELDDGCLHCHSTDYRHAKEEQKPTLETARFGVTCVACHDPHGFDKLTPKHHTDGTSPCADCHIDSMAHSPDKVLDKHYPCPPGKVGCADCHMPRIVKTGGFFSLRSHAFRIIPPAATETSGTPNSCQNGGCHEDRTVKWAKKAFKDHYNSPPAKASAEQSRGGT
uniref:Cytochrome c-552/4 domain-containing protein n=1 Tax=Magnetococcus massalia (strain MO-1) TaxID=451514 RepID=A0A1S7LEM9_MAGMO|nr:conserved exported protein of unknown function(with low similarity to Dihaem cytochrome c and contains 2 copies of Paired_CXXCH_1 domain) [Candidatus Magnetococcus massalia]